MRASLGGSDGWMTTFVMSNFYLEAVAGYIQTRTYMGRLFEDANLVNLRPFKFQLKRSKGLRKKSGQLSIILFLMAICSFFCFSVVK